MSRVDRNHGNKNRKSKSSQRTTEEEIFGNKNGRPRKKKKKRRGLRIFLAILLALFLIVGGTFLYAAFSTGLVNDPTGMIKVQDQFNNGKVNVLIVGSDIRPEDEAARSDTLLVGSFDFKAGTANILSIPRDTMVPIPGNGDDKINHAYAFGGIELTEKTVEDFLGIEIDRTVEIDFDSFKNAVDQIGGVDIEVEQDMYYPEENIDLMEGQQTLNGVDALAYVRFRGTPTGDIGRVERQQKFLMALGSGIKNKANIFQQAGIVTDMLGKMKTDINLSEAMYMFNKFREQDNFEITTWTSQGTPSTINGISYLIPDDRSDDDSREFLEGILFVVVDPDNPERKILVTADEKTAIENGTYSSEDRNNRNATERYTPDNNTYNTNNTYNDTHDDSNYNSYESENNSNSNSDY